MPELGSLGTVRGALGNGRPYREQQQRPIDSAVLFRCISQMQKLTPETAPSAAELARDNRVYPVVIGHRLLSP